MFYSKKVDKAILGIGLVVTTILMINHLRSSYSFISPFISVEKCPKSIQGALADGKYPGIIASNVDKNYFSEVEVSSDLGDMIDALLYKNKNLNEKVAFHGKFRNRLKILYLDNISFSKSQNDKIVDYWLLPFKTEKGKEYFSVCYLFKSGAVLQVADMYEMYDKPILTDLKHKFRVVRMFFLGHEKEYKKYFPDAFYETKENVKKYKEMMKNGEGMVKFAEQYIDEDLVKEKKPILDYRTNPKYYGKVGE